MERFKKHEKHGLAEINTEGYIYMSHEEVELNVNKDGPEEPSLHCPECGVLFSIEIDNKGEYGLIVCPNEHGALLIHNPESRKKMREKLIGAGAKLIEVGDKYEDNLKNRIKGFFGF